MISFPLIRYVLTAAVRDRLILSALVLMAVGASLAVFLGSAAISETRQFVVVLAAGGLRIAGAMGLVLFAVFYLRRSFETRDVDFLLSRPLSRSGFLLSHAVAFTLLAILVALFVVAAVCTISPVLIGPGHALWAFSLVVEYIIVVNTALFFAMVLPNAAVGALSVFAFYILARLIGQILGIIKAGLMAHSLEFLGTVMHLISLIIPRLDLMAQTSWLIYGAEGASYGFIALQGAIFTALVILAAMSDLARRQF